MDFEPLDEECEEFLRPIIEEAAAKGWAEDVDYLRPEYRKLKQAGMFETAQEHYDRTARVTPSYEAMKYFERKKKWKSQRAKGAAGAVFDKAWALASKLLGL